MENKKVCERCGKCCHYIVNDTLKKCKHLVTLKGGKTLCRVFNHRLGQLIYQEGDKQVRCTTRELSGLDYEGCPLNTIKPIGYTEVKNG